LIDQLVTLLGRQFGWRRDATLDNKLTLLLRDMRLEDVRDWVLELQGPGLPGVYPHELLKGVTVNETYFHRDRDQLEFLRQEALPALVAAKAARGQFRLSLWSAGCSTGEEVYTLAMIVLDVLAQRPECASFEGESGGTGPVIINMGPWSVDLLGTDIRSDVLDHARRAEYEDFGLGPFRSLPENQSRFFLPVQRRKEVSRDSKPRGLLTSSPSPENGAVASNGAGSRWLRVAPEITRLTRFQTHNLLEPPPIYGCDLVSCRNVMIYFDEEAKKRTQRNLYAALGEGGLLLLGPTDTVVEPGLFAPESPRTSPVMRKLLPPLSPLRSEGGRRGG
jgi:chemotaxis protein methyltransferase CheR